MLQIALHRPSVDLVTVATLCKQRHALVIMSASALWIMSEATALVPAA